MPKRILHLASFAGNIGDVANHRGFYKKLRERWGEMPITPVEIRDFYFNSRKRRFDAAFAEEVSDYDLFIVGGGGFFNCYWPESATGCTLDWSSEFLSSIKVPIVINAMGVDLHQGGHPEAIAKFRVFIEAMMAREDTILSVRNDGSQTLLKEMGIDTARIQVVPDFAFYSLYYQEEKRTKVTIVNLAGDVIDTRYKNVLRSEFLQALANALAHLYVKEPERLFFFVPHLLADLNELIDLWKAIGGRIPAANLCFPQFSPHERWLDQIFDLYQNADLVLGMRFHANVLGLASGAATYGVNTYYKVEALYKELGLCENIIQVNDPEELANMTAIIEEHEPNRLSLQRIENQTDLYLEGLKKLIGE